MAAGPLKRLEYAWREAWMAALGRLMPRPESGEIPDWGSRPFKVLYMRYDRIGDMILATPLLRAIATSHPGITVDVLASPINAPILAGNPHVRRVHLFDKRDRANFPRVLRALRAEGYDAIVDDHAAVRKASLTMIFVMLATGARHRIGVGGQENEFIYTIPVPPGPPGHQLEMASVLARVFDVEPDWERWRPQVELTDAERGAAEERWQRVERESGLAGPRRLLVNLSATHAARRWPDERFVETIRTVRQRHRDLAVGVIGSPAERGSVDTVGRLAGVTPVHTPSVRDAIALVSLADMVFTPDTSITHAATAFEVPVVVMLRAIAAPYLPWRVPYRAIWGEAAAFSDLPVERLVGALDELLAETAARRSAAAS